MKKSALFCLSVCLLLNISISALAYVDEVNGSTIELQEYKSNFFLLDLYAPDSLSKLQLSFKVPLMRDCDVLYFGFTQVAFWKLRSADYPFYELNYNPEFFARLHFSSTKKVGLDICPLEHESNGKDGPDTRSLNRSYFRFFQEWELGNGSSLYLNLKLGGLWALDDTNLEIGRTRGLYEINLTWVNFLTCTCFTLSDLNFRLISGGPSMMSPFDGSTDLTLRVKAKLADNFIPVFIIQFFYGRAESLIDFKKPAEFKFRFGMGF